MSELSAIFEACKTTVIAAVIDKRALKIRYASPDNPYHIALQFCMERAHRFLSENFQGDRKTFIVFEKRGDKEDKKLELEFLRIKTGANFNGSHMGNLEICMVDKKANSSGLQVADLFARPIGLKTLRPDQPNRAYDIIEKKFRMGAGRRTHGYGLKIFP